MNVNPYYIILTNLKTSASKTDVRISNWQGITERLFRSVDYGAINLNQTLPINFPRIGSLATDKGGYYFIDSAKNADGVKAQVQIEIKRLDGDTNSYVDSFIGMLDFRPSAGYNKQDEIIECKVIDSSKFSKFSSRDEIDYNVFSLVSSDSITMQDFTNPYTEATYKPVDIYAKCVSSGGLEGTRGAASIFTAALRWDYEGVTSINEIGDRVKISTTPSNNTVYINETDIDVEITGVSVQGRAKFFFIVSSFTGTKWDAELLIISKSDIIGRINTQTIATFTGTSAGLINVDEDFDFDLIPLVPDVLPPGEEYKFFFQFNLTVTLGLADLTVVITNEFDIYNYTFYEKTSGWPENQIRGLYSHEVMSRLIQLITSETDTSKLIYSTLLGRPNSEFQTYVGNGTLGLEFFTNGAQLRQLVNRALNINFKDAFKSLNAITPIGCWYDKTNDYFVIERIDNFYLSEYYTFNLGQVRDIKTTDFKELYFNTILTGYPKTEYEEFNGVNEVNTETEHEISIEEKTKYDIRSPYYGDTKGQEFARRRNVSVAASKDTKYDNNVYITSLNISNETIQGGLSDLAGYAGVEQDYNLTKTPRQNLQRHFKIIQSPLYKAPSDIFSFRKSAKDTNITYTDPETLTLVNELNNLSQYAITNNIIDPELDEFEGIINEDIANEITENPHKIIKYLDREGNRKYGYIWEVEFNRYTKEATYRLIKVNENRLP